MKKRKYLLCVILAALCALFAFAACEFGDGSETAKEEYAVTLVFNDGTTPNVVTKAKEGSSYTLPSFGPRTGYTFDGWKTGETLYKAGDAYKVTADVTFTAQWTAILYTVTFDLAEGEGDFSAPDTAMDATVTFPATEPTRDGYEFDGWVVTYLDADETAHTVEVSNDSFVMPAANVTLTAQWTRVYKVTYDLDEGTGEFSEPDTAANAKVTIPATKPMRDGYRFDGWLVTYGENQTVTVSDNSFTMPAASVTITAQWTRIYKVTYDLDEGTGSFSEPDTAADAKVTIPATKPTRDGYRFDGWLVTYGGNQTVTVSDNSFTMPAASVTITAQWTRVYKVIYDLDKGTGEFSELDTAANATVTIPKPDPSREDFEFVGWVVTYGENQTVTVSGNSFTMPAADVTVTAQWTDIVYTVTFTAENFTQSVDYIAGQKVSEGKNYRVPEARNGVPLGYWFYGSINDDSYLKVPEDTVVSDLLKARGERTITLKAEFAFVIGKEDYSTSVPENDYTPEKTVCDIGKGQLVKLSGRMKSKAAENWQTVLTYLYSGTAPKGFFRLDWWIADGTTEGENPGWNPQNVTAAEGWNIALDGRFTWPDNVNHDYSVYRASIASCDFSVTVDWTYEKEIKLTIVADGDNRHRQSMFYTITPAGADFTSDTYHIGFRADASYAEFYYLTAHKQHNFVNHYCGTCGAVDKTSLEAIQMNSVEGYDTYDPQPETDSAGNPVWYKHPSPAITVTGDFAVKFTYDQGTLESPTTVIELFKDDMFFDANPNDEGWWYAGVEFIDQGTVNTWQHGSPSSVVADAGIKVTVYVWRVGFVLYAHYEAQDASGGFLYSFTVCEDSSAISRSDTLQVRLNGLCAGGANWQAYTKPAEQSNVTE